MEQLTLSNLRLAHYIPFDNTDHSQMTKLDIVLSALLFADSLVNLIQIKGIINNHLGCEIKEGELKKLLTKGVDDGFVVSIGEKYLLDHATKSQMNSEKMGLEDLQKKVITGWITKEIDIKYPQLNGGEKDELGTKVVEFVTNIFLNHGVDSMTLIAENANASSSNVTFHQNIEDLQLGSEKLKEIALEEFPRFLTSDDSDVVTFLLSIINKSFRYLTTICDPEVIESLKIHLQGKLIYLDSSTVYRLLNLQGDHRYHVVKEVVDLCKEFGITLKVSAVTLDELKRRVEYDSRVLKKHPVPVDLEKFGYNYFTNDNFISTYWEQRKHLHITVDQFISKYKNIDLLLEEEGVLVEKSRPKQDDDFIQKKDEILQKFSERTGFEKSESAAEHDAYMFTLVDSLKGDVVVDRFMDCPAWFLTTDSFILRFQRQNYSFKERSPVALHPAQLLNVLRFTRPSGENFDKVFLDLFSKGFHSRQSTLENEDIVRILSRISLYKGYTPKLAQLLLSDEFFLSRYSERKDEAGETESVIYDALIEKAKDIEKMLLQQEEKNRLLEREKGQLTEEKESSELEIQLLKVKIDSHQKEQYSRDEEISGLQRELEFLQRKVEQNDKKKELDNQRRQRVRKKLIYTVCYLLILCLCYLGFERYSGVDGSQLIRRLLVLVGVISSLLFLKYIVSNAKIRNGIFYWILGIATLIGAIWTLIP